jgi:hypothetical protein
MDDDIRRFGEDFGRKALARDWAGVHALLAPWMQDATGLEAVAAFFEDEYRATLAANEIEGIRYPEHPEPEVDGNGHTNATALREPMSWQPGRVRPVPPEVTDENMRYWLKVKLQCSDTQMDDLGFDYLAEVWMAVVETPGGLRVGYWSQGAY